MLKTGLSFLLGLLPLMGCASMQVHPAANAPSGAPSREAGPVTLPAAQAAPAAAAPTSPVLAAFATHAPPIPGACDEPGPDGDPRCPTDVLRAAAMSYLDKTTAEFDGVAVRVVEYDAAELMAEAHADPGFVAILVAADAVPADGTLDHQEARAAEKQVLDLVDARYAAALRYDPPA